MEHVVFFPGPDGSPSFRRLPTLDDAVRYVEHLRNLEGVSEVSVHALAPVPLAFRPYYKVEVPGGEPVEMPVAPVEAAPVEVAAFVPAPAEPVGEQLPAEQLAEVAPEPSPNGRRSLGFFTH